MRCWGRKKNLSRCRNNTNFVFCPHHKFQPFVFIFTVSTIIGVYAGIFRDLIEPILKTKDYASSHNTVQDEYRPLQKQIRSKIVTNLKDCEGCSGVSYLIEDWTGLIVNRQFSEQLFGIITDAGLKVERKDLIIGFQGGYTPPPVEINVNPRSVAIFKEFIEALKPMFMDFEPKLRMKEAISDKVLRIRIFGKPKFREDGRLGFH